MRVLTPMDGRPPFPYHRCTNGELDAAAETVGGYTRCSVCARRSWKWGDPFIVVDGLRVTPTFHEMESGNLVPGVDVNLPREQ